MTETIHDKLERAGRDLLDLTSRNRLISTSRSIARSGRLEIVDELSQEVFRILVQEGKAMTFLPKAHDEDEDGGNAEASRLLFQPEYDDEREENEGVVARQVHRQLQTKLSSEKLQRKLLKLYYDAKTNEEGQKKGQNYLIEKK